MKKVRSCSLCKVIIFKMYISVCMTLFKNINLWERDALLKKKMCISNSDSLSWLNSFLSTLMGFYKVIKCASQRVTYLKGLTDCNWTLFGDGISVMILSARFEWFSEENSSFPIYEDIWECRLLVSIFRNIRCFSVSLVQKREHDKSTCAFTVFILLQERTTQKQPDMMSWKGNFDLSFCLVVWLKGVYLAMLTI